MPSVKSYYQCRYASPVTSNPIDAERNGNLLHSSATAEVLTDGWPGWQGAGEMTLVALMTDKVEAERVKGGDDEQFHLNIRVT